MTEIERLLNLTYEQCVEHFLKKYGNVQGNYFLDELCTRKNSKITRGKEGLFVHHIDEDKAIMLSSPAWAQKNPFEWQKAERLVYCNLLEHLLLHIKIVEFPNKNQNIRELCGVGGVANFLVPELNDIYSGISYKQPWKQKVIENVLPLKNDYFKCMKKLVGLKNFNNRLYPLLTSFAFEFNAKIWNKKNNEKIFDELKKIGVKY